MIKGSWYRVPECILTDQGLTLADAAVFALIADKADGSSVEISRDAIAAETGYSASTVKRSVSKLAARGYIAIEHRAGGASVYRQCLMQAKRKKQSGRAQSVPDDIAKYNCVINQFLDPVEDPNGKEVG